MDRTILSKEFTLLLFVLLAVTLWRVSVLFYQQHDLYVDEVYYWDWSNTFQWGYFSKPPVIAWIIGLTTSLCSDTANCIRSGSLILYPLTTLVIYAITYSLFANRKYAFYSAIAFFTLPAVSVSSLIISTDVPLFFFWSLTLLGFIKALQNNQWKWWILAGLAGGLGLLSKYSMGIFAVSALIYLVVDRRFSVFVNPRLWITAFIALLLWLPNLWWNYSHDFITFTHTSEISQPDGSGLQFDELIEFLGGQLAVFGLLFLPLYLYVLYAAGKNKLVNEYRLLAVFSLTFLVIISLQAVTGRANANWAAPAYVTATILVTAFLLQTDRIRLLVMAIAINVLTSSLLYYFEPLAKFSGIQLTAKNDLYKRLKGWKELGRQFDAIHQHYPDAALLSYPRDILSELNFYARPLEIKSWNPQGIVRHHFDLHHSLQDKRSPAKQYLFVINKNETKNLTKYFNQMKYLDELNAPLYEDYVRSYSVYLVSGFKGY